MKQYVHVHDSDDGITCTECPSVKRRPIVTRVLRSVDELRAEMSELSEDRMVRRWVQLNAILNRIEPKGTP